MSTIIRPLRLFVSCKNRGLATKRANEGGQERRGDKGVTKPPFVTEYKCAEESAKWNYQAGGVARVADEFQLRFGPGVSGSREKLHSGEPHLTDPQLAGTRSFQWLL